MIIDNKNIVEAVEYQTGDVLLQEGGEMLFLNSVAEYNHTWFFATYADGRGILGDSDINSPYHYQDIYSLIKAIKDDGDIIAHYPKSKFKLVLAPLAGGN